MNLKYEGSLSSFAFNCNLRHYNQVVVQPDVTVDKSRWGGAG